MRVVSGPDLRRDNNIVTSTAASRAFSVTSTISRVFEVRSGGGEILLTCSVILQVDPIAVSPTPANIKIIQPIQFVSSTERNRHEIVAEAVSVTPPRNREIFSPETTRQPRSQRPRFPNQQPALSFPDVGRPKFSARQESNPELTELPDLTPLGVRLSLEDMVRNAGQGVEMRPIPGEPGVDYPVFSEVPETGFNCRQQPYLGIYSDLESNCQVLSSSSLINPIMMVPQVFHMCMPDSGEVNSFLCPNGTMFSQQVARCSHLVTATELLPLVFCLRLVV